MNARDFAISAHGAQTYGDGRPYVAHLDEVVAMIGKHGDLFTDDERADLLAAGWLHDTVEDTPTTIGAVQALFGPRVASLVSAVSNNWHIEHRHERHLDTYAKIKSTGRLAKALKLADRIANVSNSKPGDKHAERYVDDFGLFYETLYDGEDRLTPMWRALTKLIAERS